jgi:predicted dehydrogenase
MKEFEILDVVACADMVMERAQAKATEHNIPKACTVEELLKDPEIKIVVNLTVPKVHAEIALKALHAGKCVHSEKPLGITREEGKKVLETAKKKKLLVGCAPDTFMGGGIQTCRKLLDDGWIGKPVASTAFMLGHGMESWHPDATFFYQVGGGPMFDMGPYYLTALITLLGPINRICSSTKISFPTRTITSQPNFGKKITVNTPTHLAGIMDFENGSIGTIITSFDVWAHKLPCIEIYGTEGSMIVPNPNDFSGDVLVKREGAADWSKMPYSHGYCENSRGIGVADMAYALTYGRENRASGEMAYHVLDAMNTFLDSSKEGRHLQLKSTCKRPKPLPSNLIKGRLDK